MDTKALIFSLVVIGLIVIIAGVLIQKNTSSQTASQPQITSVITESDTGSPSAFPTGRAVITMVPSPTGHPYLALSHERKKSLPQKPVVSSPSCIPPNYSGSGITIAGGNVNPATLYTEISSDNGFATSFRKDMTGSISTTAPAGFVSYPDNAKQLLLQPATTYYIRFYNGFESGYGPTATFSFPRC